MKKFLFLSFSLLLLPVLAACGETAVGGEEVREEKWDLIPMVMVDGVLYLDTGYESDIPRRCGVMDGEITSTVDGSETPTENDQSNFGTGWGYQRVGEGKIELFMNEEWRVFATEEVREALQFPSKTTEETLTAPGALTVTNGEQSVETLGGTYSWWYLNGDGTTSAIDACGTHPLESRELMGVWQLYPSTLSQADPLRVTLAFERTPDSVSARCWSAEHWDDAAAESEEIDVQELCIDTSNGCFSEFILPLKDGAFIYEITAEWTSEETFGGTAYYSFCTAVPEICSYPLAQ